MGWILFGIIAFILICIGIVLFSAYYEIEKEKKLQLEIENRKKEIEQQKRKKEIQAEKERQQKINNAKVLFKNDINNIPTVDITPVYEVVNAISEQDIKTTKITKRTNYANLKNFVVLDIETTGLKPDKNEIIEIGAIKFNNFIPIEKFEQLIKPKNKVEPRITDINGITNEMLENAPAINEVIPLLQGFVGKDNIVGHNIIFDINFLTVAGFKITKKQKIYDNLDLARRMLKPYKFTYDEIKGDVINYKLDTLCEFYQVYRDDAHRALSDCYATGLIYIELLKEYMEETE